MADVSISIDKFIFDKVPLPGEPVLEIEGHAVGIVGYILAYLGLGTISFLRVSEREVRFKFTNLGGIQYIVCPLDTITCSVCGIAKPLWRLILGVLLIVGGGYGVTEFGPTSLIAAALGAVLVFFYWSLNFFVVSFSTGEISGIHGLEFLAKASSVNQITQQTDTAITVGSQKIDVELLLEAIEYINHHLISRKT